MFIAISINGSVGLLLFILQTVTITRYKNVWIEIKHIFTMDYLHYISYSSEEDINIHCIIKSNNSSEQGAASRTREGKRVLIIFDDHCRRKHML